VSEESFFSRTMLV